MQPAVPQFHSTSVQLTKSPGNAQGMETISAEVTDLARDPRHRVAADAVTATGIKGFKSPDQPVAGFLHEIVAFAETVVLQTVGTVVSQSKVHQDRVISVPGFSGNPSPLFVAALPLELLLNSRRLCSGGHC